LLGMVLAVCAPGGPGTQGDRLPMRRGPRRPCRRPLTNVRDL